jgi:hypothetical protein
MPRIAATTKIAATMIDRPGARSGSNANLSTPRATRRCFSVGPVGKVVGILPLITQVPIQPEKRFVDPARRFSP